MGFFGGGSFINAVPTYFEWYEEKTALAGANSFTLTNIVPSGGQVLIFDATWGVVYSSPEHYTRTNQVIQLTSTLNEATKFRIYCFKKGTVI